MKWVQLCGSLSILWQFPSWDWNEADLVQSCGHYWDFQIFWDIQYSTFTASSFWICDMSTGIPLHPLALFIVILPKAHLILYSRMSYCRWVMTPSWLSGSLRPLSYSSVYSCHLFLISSFSVRSMLGDSLFIILWWFLPYINMNQEYVYMCPLPLESPSHPSLHPISLGCHRAMALGSLPHTPIYHWLSMLHIVIFMFQCYSLKS